MRAKSRIILLGIFLAVMLVVDHAGAFYANVTGELRDSKANKLWEWGAIFEVFNCFTLDTINTATSPIAPNAGYGTFDIDVSSVSVSTPLCIEVNFNDGGNGKPGNAAKGPYPDRLANVGTLNTGVYFTDTGPTAVVLKSLAVYPAANSTLLMSLTGVSLAVAVGFVLFLRRKLV